MIGPEGKVSMVVKFATDITAVVRQREAAMGLQRAVNLSNATIEFKMDGTVTGANENFLRDHGLQAG